MNPDDFVFREDLSRHIEATLEKRLPMQMFYELSRRDIAWELTEELDRWLRDRRAA